MIQINLLEQSAPRRKSSGKPGRPGAGASGAPAAGGGMGGSAFGSLLVALAIIASVGLNGGIGWLVYKSWNAAYQKYQEAQISRDKIKGEIDKKLAAADRIREYREVLNNQMDVLKTLDPPDRLLWSEKFNMLSNLVPTNVFLSQIKIEENVTMVETQASIEAREKWEKADVKKRAPAPPDKVMKPVLWYTMRITGLGLGKDNVEQFHNALNFHRAMTEYQYADTHGKTHRFMDGFNANIDFESVDATMYEGQPVNKFIFKLTTVPLGGNTDGDKAKDGSKTQVAMTTPTDPAAPRTTKRDTLPQ